MYEKAQAAENKTATEQPTEEVAVVTPVVEKPANETVVVDNTDNVPVRQGKYSVISGAGLKSFSVDSSTTRAMPHRWLTTRLQGCIVWWQLHSIPRTRLCRAVTS